MIKIDWRYIVLLVLFVSIFLKSTQVMAYNSGFKAPDHERITQFAIDALKFSPKTYEAIKSNVYEIKHSNTIEDTGGSPIYHFYNPADFHLDVIPNAKSMAVDFYNYAKKYYTDGNTVAGWRGIGHALHLLQDMAVPSHVNTAGHMYQSVFGKSGYEWWVTNNWKAMFSKRDINANGDTTIGPTDLYLDRIFNMSQFNYNIVAGDMGGYMQIMSEQTHFGGFPFDYVDGENAIEVSPFDAEYTAKMLLPMIVRLGGGLFETFCRDVNCGGPTQP